MIAHTYHDGSIGHEHEVGDRVVLNRTLYEEHNRTIPKGTKGVVTMLHPYNYQKGWCWLTDFVIIDMEGFWNSMQLACAFDSLEDARITIKES